MLCARLQPARAAVRPGSVGRFPCTTGRAGRTSPTNACRCPCNGGITVAWSCRAVTISEARSATVSGGFPSASIRSTRRRNCQVGGSPAGSAAGGSAPSWPSTSACRASSIRPWRCGPFRGSVVQRGNAWLVRVSAGTDPVTGRRLWLCGTCASKQEEAPHEVPRPGRRQEGEPDPGQPRRAARRVAAGRGARGQHPRQLRWAHRAVHPACAWRAAAEQGHAATDRTVLRRAAPLRRATVCRAPPAG